jgi:hypothetical protein
MKKVPLGKKTVDRRRTPGQRTPKHNGVLIPITKVARLKTFTQQIVPPEADVQLQTIDIGTLSGAFSVRTARYNPNALTNTVPGFSEWGSFYGFYRVIAYDYEVTVTNNEAFPIVAYILNTNNDPGLSATAFTSCNSLSDTYTIAAKGGMDRHVFTGRKMISDVVGTDAVEYADSYRALISGAPADITWLAVGAQSGSGANITLGLNYTTKLTYYVRFYDRLTQV